MDQCKPLGAGDGDIRGSSGGTDGMDNFKTPRHLVQRIVDPRLLSQRASYDVASLDTALSPTDCLVCTPEMVDGVGTPNPSTLNPKP